MPIVSIDDKDTLNPSVSITITKEDYRPLVKGKLAKIKEKGSMKGFRKGKVPDSFLNKMYGKSVLAEVVQELIGDELSKVVEDFGPKMLGQPLQSEHHPLPDLDINSPEDYEFVFEVGVSPTFKVVGVDESAEYDYYKVVPSPELVEERFNNLLKQRGERIEADDFIRENDLLTLSVAELDGEVLKEDGWKTNFSILFNRVAEGPVKTELLTKKKGDTIRFNIFELEEGTSREMVKKYLLNFTPADLEEGTETGEMYEAEITSVLRAKPAELTQELLDQLFGEGRATNEEEAKKLIAETMSESYVGPADSLLMKTFRNRIVEQNKENIPLPDEFLKRYLSTKHEEDEANKIINDYDNYADTMRWFLITNNLVEQLEINLAEGELRDFAVRKLYNLLGGYIENISLEPILENMLKDRKQVESLLADLMLEKVFFKLKESVKLKEIAVSEDEFKTIFDGATGKE